MKQSEKKEYRESENADLLILGGGAAGLYAGIAAAGDVQNAGKRILLLEKTERPGKKVSITGNGRCNLTRREIAADLYETDDGKALDHALSLYDSSQTVRDMERFGIFPVERNGGIYPESMEAASVVTLLLAHLKKSGVRIRTNQNVRSVEKNVHSGSFFVRTEDSLFTAKRVIFALGGSSYPKTGSSGDGYYYLEKLGHSIIPPLPGLVPLKADNYDESLFGVRQTAAASLFLNGEKTKTESGEIQFTRDGLSGIPVFDLSTAAIRALEQKMDVRICLSFFDGTSGELFKRFLPMVRNMMEDLLVADAFSGMLHKKLVISLLKRVGIPEDAVLRDLSTEDLRRLTEVMKSMEFRISGSHGMKEAQITSGGVPLSEIDPETMESKIVPGLFLAGEIVNVTGPCGGYNLQWAWTSGRLAGRSVFGS